ERKQFRSIFCAPVGVVLAPAGVDQYIVAHTPAQFLQALVEHRKSVLAFWIVRSPVHEHAAAPHPVGLLRPRRERPRCRAAEPRDEVATAAHSITSSARASSDGGTVRPSAFAVLRLIVRSYLVGACTGRSAGFSPLRMRST